MLVQQSLGARHYLIFFTYYFVVIKQYEVDLITIMISISQVKKLGHEVTGLGDLVGKRWRHDQKPCSLPPGSCLSTFCTEGADLANKEDAFIDIMDMVV